MCYTTVLASPLAGGSPLPKVLVTMMSSCSFSKLVLVIILHATDPGRKHTAKHILHHVGIVTGATCFSGKQNGGLDPLLVERPIHAVMDLHNTTARHSVMPRASNGRVVHTYLASLLKRLGPWKDPVRSLFLFCQV